MKTILIALFSGFSILVNSQETVLNIKTSASAITGSISNSVYQQDRSQFKYFISILNLDQVGYNELMTKSVPGTNRESDPGSTNPETERPKLEGLRDQIISTTYYLDFVPDYLDERTLRIKYNAKTRSFPVSNEVHNSSFFDDPEYLQLDQFLFKCPAGITVSKRNINYSCMDMVAETISVGINDVRLASKIEENSNHLRLLFVFNVTGTATNPAKITATTLSDYFIMTNLLKVIAYNSSTNEIYCRYEQ